MLRLSHASSRSVTQSLVHLGLRAGTQGLLIVLLSACHGTEPPSLSFAAVSAGSLHTCALTTSGAAYCWGRNASGQLGTGDTSAAASPVAAEGSRRFTHIAAGFMHTCALRDDGAAFCWGENGNGELGDGTTTDRSIPTAVAGGLSFTAISTGEGATCALTAVDAGLYCWGVDLIGVNANPRDHLRPARYASGRYLAVSVGYEIACALHLGGQVVCWGYGAEGQLGDGTLTSSDIPLMVDQSAAGAFRTISSGHDHSCALDAAGSTWCWGSNDLGQLGTAMPVRVGIPLQADGGAGVDSVFAHSAGHTCVLRSGTAECWGGNGFGQLGDGSASGGIAARAVAGGIAFRQVSTGFAHTCGLDSGGALWCWGDNSVGQLGTAGGASSRVPVRVAVP